MEPLPDVLVVDDDPGIRLLVSAVLEDHGLLVRTSADGREALTACRQRRPALILLDLEMPRMDGRTFVRELRHLEHRPPVLVLSAYGAREAADEMGVEDWISKPFDEVRLIRKVRELLNAG